MPAGQRHNNGFWKRSVPGGAAGLQIRKGPLDGPRWVRLPLSSALAFSRQMFVEFTVSQTMEHFLACHEHGFAALGVPSEIMRERGNPHPSCRASRYLIR